MNHENSLTEGMVFLRCASRANGYISTKELEPALFIYLTQTILPKKGYLCTSFP
jgi:hypothetical protein